MAADDRRGFEWNISLRQGDDYQLLVTPTDESTGLPLIVDSVSAQVFQAGTVAGSFATVTDGSTGVITLSMSDTVTAGLELGRYQWELRATENGGTLQWLTGSFTLSPAGGPRVSGASESAVFEVGGSTVVDVQIPAGAQGPAGPAGPGVPQGGAQNDVLVKQSGTDYDTAFQDEVVLDQLTFDVAAAETLANAGEMAWNTDRETVELRLDSALSTFVNQDTLYHVVNQTGVTIPKGTVVRADGTLGNSGKILITPFLANGTVSSQTAMGVTAEDIGDGAEGFVVHFGLIRNVDTNAYVDGQLLWASSTVAGGFTTTAPAAPNNNVLVAIVIKAANNGVIFVRPTLGSSLANDEMVNLAGVVSGDGIAYNGSVFVPAQFAPRTPTVGSGLGTSGTVNLDMAALNGTYQTISLTGDPTFTTSNRAAGRTVTIRLVAGGSSRTLAWPSWVFVGSAAPTTLAANKTAVVTVTMFDTTDAGAVAAYAAQP